LAKSDHDHFQRISPAGRTEAFFRVWTAKEAYLKAVGLGLPGGLKEVAVPMDEADPFSPRIFHPLKQSSPWCLQTLPLPEGYTGCVVWEDPGKALDFQVVRPVD
jgi:4'-phosphopantetheinyl transferase